MNILKEKMIKNMTNEEMTNLLLKIPHVRMFQLLSEKKEK